MLISRRTWTEVDLDAILENYRTITQLAPNSQIMAVVKADAYGHGDIAVAQVLEQAGAGWFAVSNIEEAILLREQEIKSPILILGYTPVKNAPALASYRITQALYSAEYAQALNESALAAGIVVDCHIKLDTGMSRIGFCAQKHMEAQAAEEVATAYALPALSCTGIFTHFACADEPNGESDRFTETQFQVFSDTLAILEEKGIRFALRHCCNSAGILRFPAMHLDMVRAGIILYGLSPAPECVGMARWKPAMRFYSTVTMVKDVTEGTQVSYGRTYTSPTTKRLATVAVGYADGFRRKFSNKGRVIIQGEYAPIVGRVCMDQMLVDVTGIPDVAMGDRVTLVGCEGECSITFDEFARLNESINYEEICLIGRRVPRVYIQNGKPAHITNYLLQTIDK